MRQVVPAQIEANHRYLIFRPNCGHFLVGVAFYAGNGEAFGIDGTSTGLTWWQCSGCEKSFETPTRSAMEHVFWEIPDGV